MDHRAVQMAWRWRGKARQGKARRGMRVASFFAVAMSIASYGRRFHQDQQDTAWCNMAFRGAVRHGGALHESGFIFVVEKEHLAACIMLVAWYVVDSFSPTTKS